MPSSFDILSTFAPSRAYFRDLFDIRHSKHFSTVTMPRVLWFVCILTHQISGLVSLHFAHFLRLTPSETCEIFALHSFVFLASDIIGPFFAGSLIILRSLASLFELAGPLLERASGSGRFELRSSWGACVSCATSDSWTLASETAAGRCCAGLEDVSLTSASC